MTEGPMPWWMISRGPDGVCQRQEGPDPTQLRWTCRSIDACDACTPASKRSVQKKVLRCSAHTPPLQAGSHICCIRFWRPSTVNRCIRNGWIPCGRANALASRHAQTPKAAAGGMLSQGVFRLQKNRSYVKCKGLFQKSNNVAFFAAFL